LNIEVPPSEDILAEFHDAELQTIVMDRNQKTLALVFDLNSGNKRTISFYDVLAYKLSDIYYQNVVSRLLLSSLGTMDSSDLDQALGLVYDRRPAGQPSYPDTIKSDILNQDLLLFYLDPSVGAEAAVIAKKILVS
jgi:hypothetical protein